MRREPLPQAYLGRLPEFGLGGLPPGAAELFTYQRGECLSNEGQPISHLQFILEGRVKAQVNSNSGRTMMFCFDGPGDLIGSIELLSGLLATATAVAVLPTSCIAVAMRENMDFFQNDVDFLRHLATDLSLAFARSSKNAATNVLYPLKTRLCSYISMTQENGLFAEKLTETGDLLGASYRHLLRCLDGLCAAGVLQKSRRGYRVQNPAELDRLAQDYYSMRR